MDWGRRELLAAGAGLLAGCNTSQEAAPDRTATAVEVPRDAGETLADARAVPVPSVPTLSLIDDAHRRSVVAHVQALIRAGVSAVSGAHAVDTDDVEGLWHSNAPFVAARRRLRRYRNDPSRRRFMALTPSVADVATIVGRGRVATGRLDGAEVRDAYRTARGRTRALVADLEYRVASPVERSIPTLRNGAAALDRARRQRRVAGRNRPTADAATSDVVAGWRSIELLRLETTNAAGYLESASDPAAAPRGDAITAAARATRQAVASTALPDPPGESPPPPVAVLLDTVRSRRSGVVAGRNPTDGPPASRVRALLAAARAKVQTDAITAATRTTARQSDDGIPPAAVPRAKRRAVGRLERLAAAPPLQRDLGGAAARWLGSGADLEAADTADPLTWAFFGYTAARLLAARAIRNGERLAARLAADGPSSD